MGGEAMRLQPGFYLVNSARDVTAWPFDTLEEALAARATEPHKHELAVLDVVRDNFAWGE
jgi:hypothetical protein